MSKASGTQVDQVMDAYLRWREAAALVQHAYDSWSTAGRDAAREACELYAAALDEEGRAAYAYALVTGRASRVIEADEPTAARDARSAPAPRRC